MSDEICNLYAEICELACELGWKNIQALPGCQEHQIDEHWWFAINPHGEPGACSKSLEVPSYSVYVQYNGFPFGAFNAGGGFVGCGVMANKDALLEAIDRAMKALEKTR